MRGLSICSKFGRLQHSSALSRGICNSSLLLDGEVGAASGAPESIYQRKVVIYSPARTASQQGLAKTSEKPGKGSAWKIEFSTQDKWQNQLIGWTSTADPLEHVARSSLTFASKDDAAAFCKKHGWPYEIREPHLRRAARAKRYLGYGDNFSVKRGGYPEGGLLSELPASEK